MTVVAVIPVKDFAEAKLRLRGVLPAPERAALAKAMASDVLRAVGDARGVDRCVVTGGKGARRLATAQACGYCDDSDCDSLSAAITRAAERCADTDATTLLVLPGDLPALRGADIDQLLGLHGGGLTLCPASRDGGTNALVLTPPDAIEFHYGRDSARRHLAAAQRAGLDCQCLALPALGLDIDTPDDLRRLAELRAGPATRAWLQRDTRASAAAAAVVQ